MAMVTVNRYGFFCWFGELFPAVHGFRGLSLRTFIEGFLPLINRYKSLQAPSGFVNFLITKNVRFCFMALKHVPYCTLQYLLTVRQPCTVVYSIEKIQIIMA
jgi:hypothetical protein